MLTIERREDFLVLISDDANAENAALSEAVGAAAPHMAEAFEQIKVGEDGRLRFAVQRDDWRSLLEVIEELGCMTVGFGGLDINMDELAVVEAEVERAVESGDG